MINSHQIGFQKLSPTNPADVLDPETALPPSLSSKKWGIFCHRTLKPMMQKAVCFFNVFCFSIWVFPKMIVRPNHPFWGTPMFWKHPYVSNMRLILNVFFSHGCQQVSDVDQLKLTPVAPKISAIPAIEVLGKPVSRRIT